MNYKKQEKQEKAPPKSKKLLVVDDNRFAREVIKKILINSNTNQDYIYTVTEAENGLKALEYINAPGAETEFDAFLLDIEMPGFDGIELCRRIRKTNSSTPILMVTALDESKKLSECLAEGADDFINKPADATVVHARLKGLIKRHEALQELEKLKSTLARYVSPHTEVFVTQSINKKSIPEPEEHNLCIMFTDIRGFTSIAQYYNLQKLFGIVSRTLSMHVEAIYQHGGYVDKFGGDGIMAVFKGKNNSKEEYTEACANACACALEIMVKTSALKPNEDMDKESEDEDQGKGKGKDKDKDQGKGKEKDKEKDKDEDNTQLPLGIGIHSGPAIIGNIGNSGQLDYSAIGNTINFAARICGTAGPMEIIVSEIVKNTCKGHHLSKSFIFGDERLEKIRGTKQEMKLYTLNSKEALEKIYSNSIKRNTT